MPKEWIAHRIEMPGVVEGTWVFKPQPAMALAKFLNQKGIKPAEVIVIDREQLDICYWGEPESTTQK